MTKPRIINTTDLGADPDDEQSLVRFFVSANEYDTEGLIVVTSCWRKQQSDTAMLDRIIDAYEKALPNLQQHAEGFPTADYFRSITKLGQTGFGMADVGDGKNTPGSDLIIEAVDKDDPRPVWVTLWGGANTLAQAVWYVRATRSDEAFNNFISKLRVYDVLGQDDCGAWMTKNFPDLYYIRAKNVVYNWQPSEDWIHKHIMSHGELGKVYPEKEWTYEGDTPAFMYLLPNGLSDPEHMDWGNWGGRFDAKKKVNVRGMEEKELVEIEPRFDDYSMHTDAAEGGDAIRRWKRDIENDFQARIDWSVTPVYEEANHQPNAVLMGEKGKDVLYLDVEAGIHLALSAEGSTDPDGDALNYEWTYYQEPSSYKGTVSIKHNAMQVATLDIPTDAKGCQLHIILRVYDEGRPSLCAYRRAVITVN